MRLLVLIVIACSLTIPQASVSGNNPQAKPQMVMLHVRVTDSMGRAVVDVPQSGFVVTEDGVPQTIAHFIKDETPLSYGLLIDSSGSLRAQYEQVMEAAEQIVQSNRPADETFLIRFVSSDKIYTNQEPTSDKAQLIKILREFYIEAGQSAVIDAVYLGAEKLAQQKSDPGSPRRRLLVLITDGEDRASYYKPEMLFNLLAPTDVQIFTIALTKDLKPASRDKAVNLLTRLGDATGGQTFFVASNADIERTAKEIINEIRTLYVIGYVPAGIEAAKDFHKVQVSIRDNSNARVVVTRVGYSSRN